MEKILFLVNKKENAFQVYNDGKFIDTNYLYSRNSKNIKEAIKKEIYFSYNNKKYNTKILFYGHDFLDTEDFPDEDTWNWYFNRAKAIKYHFFTSLKVKHGSGYWYQFILPRAIVDNKELKIVRWLNFYQKITK